MDWAFGFRVEGFRGLRFRDQGLEYRISGLEFAVWGLGSGFRAGWNGGKYPHSSP